METKAIKRIEPKAGIQEVAYTLDDGTKIVWTKFEGKFKVLRKLSGQSSWENTITDLSPSIDSTYFLLESDDFRPI